MNVLEFRANQQIIKKGQKIDRICVVVSGEVAFTVGNQVFNLESGAVIGLLACHTGIYKCDYTAIEDTTLVTYDFKEAEDLDKIFDEQPKYAYAFLHATLVQTRDILERYEDLLRDATEFHQYVVENYEEYLKECERLDVDHKDLKRMRSLEPLRLEQPLEQWKMNYLYALSSQPDAIMTQFYGQKKELCIAQIIMASQVMEQAIEKMEELTSYVQQYGDILLNESEDDLLAIMYDWSMKLAAKGSSVIVMSVKVRQLQSMIDDFAIGSKEYADERFRQYWGTDFERYVIAHESELDAVMTYDQFMKEDFLQDILDYVEYDEAKSQDLKMTLTLVKECPDIHSSENDASALRRGLSKHFYDIYATAFLRSVTERSVSPVIEMFLRFGCLDTGLLETQQVESLFELNSKFRGVEVERVYTMYEWLRAIYLGAKEPSRNDFDQDYAGYLIELRKQHQITEQEAKERLEDTEGKIRFEIENMFRTANRATYGRVTAFCPVLMGIDLIRLPEQMLVDDKVINASLDANRKIDFSCFFREAFFSDVEHGIPQTLIWREVLPDIILMPNAGSRGMMWQEVSGVRKDTPARFMFPIFTVDDVNSMMIDVMARYRWEICRKIQGVRWNDIREKSLTSEYSDYIQYYKKNSEISMPNKEKIKQQLVQAKNSYREVFVQDYRTWIKYESKGNVRLNSTARKIIVNYVPFSKDIRESLKDNPMFKELFTRYEIVTEKKYLKLANIWKKYQEAGGQMTAELQTNVDFYHM